MLDVLNAAALSFEQPAQCRLAFCKRQTSQIFTATINKSNAQAKAKWLVRLCSLSKSETPLPSVQTTSASMMALTLSLAASSTISG